MEKRYLTPQVLKDLKKKMVFLGGPRQVGKTTLAENLLPKSQTGYLNWDIATQRQQILNQQFPNTPLWVFDEIHKYRSWRNYLKGVYDEYKKTKKILVTGSARLDLYRRGGDSLQGRYHYLRMHPFSVAELQIKSQPDFENFLRLGSFPEPFLEGSELEAKRWSTEYRSRLIHDDISSLEQVQNLGQMELLLMRLPDLVGSPISINALREDLQVSHKAVKNWLAIYERLYAIFFLSPLGAPHIRAVKKEQKHYHYEWSVIENLPSRFENLVASHLLKWVHFEQDTQAREVELRYFRDTDKREVDFIITEKKKPILAIECKWEDQEVDSSLTYFKRKFPTCECWQISAKGKKDFINSSQIRVSPAITFLQTLI